MKKLMIAAILITTLFLTSGCAADKSDKLKVGVKIDVPGFGYQNPETGQVEGFEVDIARELASRIKGSPDALSITGVNVTTRGAMLDNGALDAVLATFTITEARKKSYHFSDPYYTDYLGILVKKDDGIHSFEALDGKTIGVAQSATTKDKLEELAQKEGISLRFNEYATYPEIKIALVSGRVDAFSVDRSILAGYADDTTMLLDDRFGAQNYGVATALSNEPMTKAVNSAISDMLTDGTIDKLQEKWHLTGGQDNE